MKANGFFGNWAKHSMEKREMNLNTRIELAISNPELYQKEQLLALLHETKQFYTNKAVPTDPIYDESGFQVGEAGVLAGKISSKDYFTCAAKSTYELEHQVNKMVKVGYKPCGGLSIHEGKFYQAVFLDLPTDKQEAPTYDKNYLHF